MRVLKARAALLSDFEVLQLLRDSEAEQRHEARSRKEQHVSDTEVAPNFRTMQFEAITSLSQPFRACSLQKAENIRAYSIVKATQFYANMLIAASHEPIERV